MPFTLRETPATRSIAVQGGVLACLVGLFTFTGPFGTYDSMGPAGRFGYWGLVLGINWVVCASVMMLTRGMTADASWPVRGLVLAGAAVIAAVPGTAVVYTAEILFRPAQASPAILPTLYAAVAVLMLAIGLPVTAMVAERSRRRAGAADAGEAPPRRTGAGAAAPADAPGRAGARFLDRLPPELGRDLVYLKMADHYIEAFTTAGSTLVLMRFADAVAELEGAGGLRVHRSYWVAAGHVTGTARRAGRTVLRLTGGHEAPVSRAYLPAVRAAGLL